MAVVCVVDGSITLAAQWNSVIQYIPPLMTQLAQQAVASALGNPPPKNVNEALAQFQIAIVTYGSADTRPNPIIRKQYFTNPHIVTRQLKEKNELGVGQCSSGGKWGMATLEGLVSALELFDLLLNSGAKPFGCHILHIASSRPSGATRPMWNRLASLDHLNWDNLPEEVKKRGINFSTILTGSVPELEAFHQKMGARSVPPHFAVQAGHILLLSGLRSQPPGVAAPTKRPLDDPSPKTPERSQKPKTESSHPSPTQTSASSQSTASAAKSLPVNQVPQPPQDQVEKIKHIWTQFRALEEEIKRIMYHIAHLKQQNVGQNPTPLQQALKVKHEKYERTRAALNVPQFREILVTIGALKAGTEVESFMSRQRAGMSQRPVPAASISPQTSVPTQNTQPLGQPASVNTLTRQQSDINDQLTKLMGSVPLTSNPIPLSSPQPKPHHTPPNAPNVMWTGILAWVGNDSLTKMRKEMSMEATARHIASDCRWHLWPKNVALTPWRKPPGFTNLQPLIKDKNAGVVFLQAAGSTPETRTESMGSYSILRSLLQTKNVAGLAHLTPDSDGTRWVLIIFPMVSQENPSQGQLLGAVLSLQDLPSELGSVGTGSESSSFSGMGASSMMAHQMAMVQFLQHRQAQNQLNTPNRPPGVNLPQFVPSVNGTALPDTPTANPGMRHQRTPSGNAFPSNFPPEAMQSFLKRTQEDGARSSS